MRPVGATIFRVRGFTQRQAYMPTRYNAISAEIGRIGAFSWHTSGLLSVARNIRETIRAVKYCPHLLQLCMRETELYCLAEICGALRVTRLGR